MAITPPYVKLSNGDVIIFEKLGPKTTAVLLNSEGVVIRKGTQSFSASERVLVEEIISGFPDPKPTIVEEVLTPPPPPPTPAPTPPQIEQTRQEEAAVRQQTQQTVELQQIPESVITDNTPDQLKPKGKNKLGQRILNLGNQVLKLVIPKLEALALEYISDAFEQARQEALSQGVEALAQVKEQYCPTPETLNQLIETRNNIVDQLNSIGDRLNLANTTVQGLTNTANVTQTVRDTASTVELALILSIGAGVLPATALGPVIANSDRLKKLIDTVEPQINNINSALYGTSVPLGVVSYVITQAVSILSLLDVLINFCSSETETDTSLTPISDTIQNVTIRQVQANVNSGSYNGFIIKIEEVPYSPTVTRRKAVALNQSGIALLETPLSFTTNEQTLINELKLIIDRDNLRSY